MGKLKYREASHLPYVPSLVSGRAGSTIPAAWLQCPCRHHSSQNVKRMATCDTSALWETEVQCLISTHSNSISLRSRAPQSRPPTTGDLLALPASPTPPVGLGVTAPLKVTQSRDHDHRVLGGKGQTCSLQEEVEKTEATHPGLSPPCRLLSKHHHHPRKNRKLVTR